MTDPHVRDWPRFEGPGDLAAIEAIPLERRDLPGSVYELLRRAGTTWPDRPAVTLLPSAARWAEPEEWTYADLLARVHRIANTLTGLGIGRRDAVGLLAPNTGDVLAATLAAETAGVAAPINPGLHPRQIAGLLRESRARVLLAAGPELDRAIWDGALELAGSLGLTTVLAIRPDGAASERPDLGHVDGVLVAYLDELAADASATELVAPPPTTDDIAGYFHTGGSTGAPKVAVHTHGNQVAMAWMIAASTDDRAPVLLAALPMFHVNALLVTAFAPLFRGRQVVWAGPVGYRDPELYGVFWKIVERYRIALMSAVPTVYAVLAQVPIDADISTLAVPVVGAAPLPDAVRRQFREHTGVDLCEGYGLTEGTCASARECPDARRPGTLGLRMPYQRVKAVRIDPDTSAWTDLPTGESGVLAISGPNVFRGYLRQTDAGPEADPTGRVVDGWLDTGDLGSVDADGYVTVTGRAKDLIIRGGHNIDPAALEEAMLGHPEVVAAAAVGRPDRHAGEVPVVYAVLRPDATATPESLTEWAASRAPERAAVPRKVHVVDEIPLTVVGKPYKPALREDALLRTVRDEIARLGLEGITATVEAERDQPVVVVDPAGRTELGPLSAALDGYAFAWRLR